MKRIFLLIFLQIVFVNLYSQIQDTTFTAKLNDDGKEIKINLKVKEIGDNAFFFLDVYGESASDTIPYNDYTGIEIIDIQTKDKYKEILISSGGSPEYCYWVFRYNNGLKLLCKALYYDSFEPDGNGTIYANFWTGFCMLTDKYILTKDGEKLEKEVVDYYPVKKSDENGYTDYTAKVKKPFKLLKSRDNKSEIAAETIKGETITITGYDTKYIKIMNKNVEETWVWIQMKTSKGKTGWILMNAYDTEFWDNLLDGVMFAG